MNASWGNGVPLIVQRVVSLSTLPLALTVPPDSLRPQHTELQDARSRFLYLKLRAAPVMVSEKVERREKKEEENTIFFLHIRRTSRD